MTDHQAPIHHPSDKNAQSMAVLCYATFPNQKIAQQIAENLLDRKLIACANIFPGVTSLYHWENKLVQDSEAVMIAKTVTQHENTILTLIKNLHPYDTPCIIFMPVKSGNIDFLSWVQNEVSG